MIGGNFVIAQSHSCVLFSVKNTLAWNFKRLRSQKKKYSSLIHCSGFPWFCFEWFERIIQISLPPWNNCLFWSDLLWECKGMKKLKFFPYLRNLVQNLSLALEGKLQVFWHEQLEVPSCCSVKLRPREIRTSMACFPGKFWRHGS